MNRIASRYKRVINWYKKTEHASIRRAVNNTVVYDYGYSCIVHSKLDYCNSLYHSLPNCQLNRLQQIQNSLARAVVKAPKSTHHSHSQISALAQGQRRIGYNFFSLSYLQSSYNQSLQPDLSLTPSHYPLLVTVFRPATNHLIINGWWARKMCINSST